MKNKHAGRIVSSVTGPSRTGLALAFLVVLFFMAFVFMPYARMCSNKTSCRTQLERIGEGLQGYRDCYGRFPPATVLDANGKPLHSWRVLLAPFLQNTRLMDYYVFDEPWNGPTNQRLNDVFLILDDESGHRRDITLVRQLYCCPSAASSRDKYTNYVMIVDADRPVVDVPRDFPLTDVGLKAQFSAGGDIIVVEIANSDIHWMEPRDLTLSEMSFLINDPSKPSISSQHIGGAFVLKKDGTVSFLDKTTTETRLQDMLFRKPHMNGDAGQ